MVTEQVQRRRKARGAAARVETRRLDRAGLVALGAVLMMTLFTFLPVLWNDFTNWDDPENVTSNPLVMSPSWSGLAEVWTTAQRNLYVPLAYTSFIIDGMIGRGQPWAFHATNLLLHLGAVAAVFAILRLMLGTSLPVAAAAGALIFALHPLQVEAVAWVTGRKDVLAGFLGLLAIFLHLRGSWETDDERRKRYTGAAVVAFALSLLAKPAGVALPVAVLAMEALGGRVTLRQSALRLLPWFGIAVIFTLATMAAQPLPEFLKQAVPEWRRPMLAGYALAFYAGKVLWPTGLAPVYPLNAPEVAADSWNLIYVAAVFAVVCAAAWCRGKFAVVLCIFITPLLPVLGLTPFLYQQISMTADRYVYVSMLAIALAAAWAVEYAWSRGSSRRGVAVVAGMVIAVCCVLSVRQTRFWAGSETLWTRAVSVSPGVPEAHTNLGFVLHHRQESEAAERQFELAVEADPEFTMAWSMLGLLRLERTGPESAIPALREAIRTLEERGYGGYRLAEGYNNLGVALERKGDYGPAEEQFRKSLSITEGGNAYGNLAELYQKLGRHEEAKHAREQAAKWGLE